ncbi:MAG: HDIG domain-containing protein [Candidatus Omnitrophica bacterium]|nr:HDIG domain-containing protein [Candidatus Omnitrophota bacterium]MBU1870468.1 HDIG domain-containing protein [Candidatus Omnitrophota bacterium]
MTNLKISDKLNFIFWSAVAIGISTIFQVNIAVTLFLIFLCAYLKFMRPDLKKFNLLNLIFLFVIVFAASFVIVRKQISPYYIPFALIPMIATLLFNKLEISILLSLACAVALGSIAGNSFILTIIFLISGSLSSMLVLDARKRSTIIRAGIIVSAVQALALMLLESFKFSMLNQYFIILINGFVSSLVVLGVLPIFEHLFKTVTNVSLLELADFNHPLLQRMILEAPGTYHHSLIVGNLSESACKAVGANALLARIGAYYHDIGKIEKAEYFSENQQELSKHDALSPMMSKMIIINHVKDGAELAKKYRFSPVLIDFILQHHGSSLVYYFYRRALENLEDDQKVLEEGFRYPGPKPSTKETAVVLLADSVEAATRALKEPSPAKIQEVVYKIINNKFIDRQLDECDLTLKDLEKISEVFVRILGGIYHSRVTYPENTSSENHHKKPAKEDSHQSEKDQRSNP